jgi:putative hemolysin
MDDDAGPQVFGQLLILFILILVNAFFAASEMAMISVDKNKISARADDGDKKAKMLLDLLREPSRFLSTIQVGITLAGFLYISICSCWYIQ